MGSGILLTPDTASVVWFIIDSCPLYVGYFYVRYEGSLETSDVSCIGKVKRCRLVTALELT